jgi:hypothetical protein
MFPPLKNLFLCDLRIAPGNTGNQLRNARSLCLWQRRTKYKRSVRDLVPGYLLAALYANRLALSKDFSVYLVLGSRSVNTNGRPSGFN